MSIQGEDSEARTSTRTELKNPKKKSRSARPVSLLLRRYTNPLDGRYMPGVAVPLQFQSPISGTSAGAP